MQPENKNSGRKLTSQSTQPLTMSSPISTSPARILFTPQWHSVRNIQYNEIQPTPSLMPRSFSSMINLSSTQPMPLMMQYQNIPTTNLNTLNNNHWSTASSPFPYEVVKCYGCSQKFADKYRIPPYNIVVKHKDRRIRGYNPDGSIMFAPDFQNTYYHLNTTHILRKNPEFKYNVMINDYHPSTWK